MTSRRSVKAETERRGHKRIAPKADKRLARALRADDPRVQAAAEQARAEREALERRIAAEAVNPALGATEGAAYVAERKAERERDERLPIFAPERHRFEPYEGDPKAGWTIGQARQMVLSGYSVIHVMGLTGCGYRWFDDMALDEHGRVRHVR